MSSLRKEGQFYRPQANTFPSNKNILKVQLCNWNFQKAFSNSILGIIQVHLQKKSEVHTNNTSKKAMKKAFKVALTATKYIKVCIKLQQVGSNQRPAFSNSLKSEKYLELYKIRLHFFSHFDPSERLSDSCWRSRNKERRKPGLECQKSRLQNIQGLLPMKCG